MTVVFVPREVINEGSCQLTAEKPPTSYGIWCSTLESATVTKSYRKR